jgi:hypothetical protein
MPEPKDAQSLLDLIFPKYLRQSNSISDDEARMLYAMWYGSPVGTEKFASPAEADTGIIQSLKTKGFVCGYGAELAFTEKGKKIIVEMVTNEPNALEKTGEIPYSKLKAKASHRPRQTFVTKHAAKDEEEPKKEHTFNLRRLSVLRMGINDSDNKQQGQS